MAFKTLLFYGGIAAMGAGVFYLATKDVRSGAKIAKDGAQQFRKNIKTMREWAEEAADGAKDKAKEATKKLKD